MYIGIVMKIRALIKKNKTIVNFVRGIRKLKGINLGKTIYINFKTQRLPIALKFPILVYGALKIVSLTGHIKIEGPIKFGMIRLGKNWDLCYASKGSALLYISGDLIFKGAIVISCDYSLFVKGTCVIGRYCAIGNGVKIRCWQYIEMGEETRVACEAQLFDTNFHYMRDIKTGKVYPCSSDMVIGKNCWIGNRAVITKGAKLPSYTLVASNSLVNKDFTTIQDPCITLAGAPAKFVKSGLARVYSGVTEQKINKYFEDNPEAEYYQAEIGIWDETMEIVDDLFR